MAIKPRVRKRTKRKGNPGIQMPPPIAAPRQMPGQIPPPMPGQIPQVPPPRQPAAAPRGNDMFTDADKQKLQKLNTYKTRCENLAKLYKEKHDNEIIPLVRYINQIREQTPDKPIGELNIPKFISSLKTINIPDFNDNDLQRKVDEQKEMMARSEKRVEEIRKKISALKGEPLPANVLQANPGVVVPAPANQPREQKLGRAARFFKATKNLATKATRKLRGNKSNPGLPRPVGIGIGKGKGAKGGYKNTKKRKKKF